MMHYNGVYVASESSQAITGADVLIELQVPSGTKIDILRMWVGASDNAIDDTQEIDIYLNDAAGTGGTGLTELEIRGAADAASAVVALGGATIGATPTVVYPDGFHLLNGWLYTPIPPEMIRIVGATGQDNIGFRFPTAPGASVTVSYGVKWGEFS